MNLTDLADSIRLNVALAEKLIELTEPAGTGPDASDVKAATDVLVAARELRALTADVARIAEDMVVYAMGEKRTATLDGHTIEIRRSYRRTDWKHSRLATHVALKASGGEMYDQLPEVVDAFLKACRPEWRISYLKEIGLDDQDYCERELGRATVSVL